MSNDTASAQSDEAPAHDDGMPAASRKPDAIAREIELTRAEIADTVDAIADRISPKRAASRGAQAVKAQVSHVIGRSNGDAPHPIDLDAPTTAGTPATGAAAQPSGRVDPRLLVAGGLVGAVIAFVVIHRMKRS
jgi:Protein of unknown function (DUF3618)